MANETFTYPTTAASATLTFATAGHFISDDDIIIPNQVTDKTAGGVRLTYNRGTESNIYEVSVIVPDSSTSETDYTDIKNFIGSTAINFSENAFKWNDFNGTTRIVHLINQFRAEAIGGSIFRRKITFLLEEQNT